MMTPNDYRTYLLNVLDVSEQELLATADRDLPALLNRASGMNHCECQLTSDNTLLYCDGCYNMLLAEGLLDDDEIGNRVS